MAHREELQVMCIKVKLFKQSYWTTRCTIIKHNTTSTIFKVYVGWGGGRRVREKRKIKLHVMYINGEIILTRLLNHKVHYNESQYHTSTIFKVYVGWGKGRARENR